MAHQPGGSGYRPRIPAQITKAAGNNRVLWIVIVVLAIVLLWPGVIGPFFDGLTRPWREVPATVVANDPDSDGLTTVDACPNEAGLPANNGCPETVSNQSAGNQGGGLVGSTPTVEVQVGSASDPGVACGTAMQIDPMVPNADGRGGIVEVTARRGPMVVSLWFPGNTQGPWGTQEVAFLMPSNTSIESLVGAAGTGWDYPSSCGETDVQQELNGYAQRRATDTSFYGTVTMQQLIDAGFIRIRFQREPNQVQPTVVSPMVAPTVINADAQSATCDAVKTTYSTPSNFTVNAVAIVQPYRDGQPQVAVLIGAGESVDFQLVKGDVWTFPCGNEAQARTELANQGYPTKTVDELRQMGWVR